MLEFLTDRERRNPEERMVLLRERSDDAPDAPDAGELSLRRQRYYDHDVVTSEVESAHRGA